ncbi:hypothetical protein [Paraburkholderia phenazinium]|uniref:Uncharacterized protein n=1 Tax=Paraburkholderia phenazinium TaxID=60549 RepID=A0A1N6K8X0_9BURK|nr:hypothetical protein [Paraburkholderia phenazinium]SIO53018.1 hypothetical protein SAMN05444168_6436 [Paraburkholderia phenazinium]
MSGSITREPDSIRYPAASQDEKPSFVTTGQVALTGLEKTLSRIPPPRQALIALAGSIIQIVNLQIQTLITALYDTAELT